MLGPPQDVSYPTLSPYRLSGRAVGHLKQVHSTCGFVDGYAGREGARCVGSLDKVGAAFVHQDAETLPMHHHCLLRGGGHAGRRDSAWGGAAGGHWFAQPIHMCLGRNG